MSSCSQPPESKQDRDILEVLPLNGQADDQMSTNVVEPLLLFRSEPSVSSNLGEGSLDPRGR